jgi:hypothetical protein
MSSPSGRMNIARINIEIVPDTRESNGDVLLKQTNKQKQNIYKTKTP